MDIYLIRNLANGKLYVGQSYSFKARWSDHLLTANRWRSRKELLADVLLVDRAIAKYGVENFTIEKIAESDSQSEINALEEFYIKQYNSRDLTIGYNLRSGGSKGRHHESSKALMSEIHRKRARELGPFQWVTNGVSTEKVLCVNAIPEGWVRGRTLSVSGLNSIRTACQARKGKKMLGRKPWSQQARENARTAHRGKKFSTETRAKMSSSCHLRKRKRANLRICYCCFKPFAGNLAGVTCKRSCHYQLESIVNSLGSSAASMYWQKLSPEERILSMKKRFESRKLKKEKSVCLI